MRPGPAESSYTRAVWIVMHDRGDHHFTALREKTRRNDTTHQVLARDSSTLNPLPTASRLSFENGFALRVLHPEIDLPVRRNRRAPSLSCDARVRELAR